MAVLLAAIESSLASAFNPAESGAKGSDAGAKDRQKARVFRASPFLS